MDFISEINNCENNINKKHYSFKTGSIPILFIAVHTVYQKKKNKLSEPYTGAIARYISNYTNCYYAIKSFDDSIDSNSLELDDFKSFLLSFINKHNIKLVFDIHGANINRDFDIEFGYLNGLSSDLTVIKNLEYSLIQNDINKIEHNNPFKGGGITKAIFENTNIDVIQVEINKKFRDKNNLLECKKICTSFITFIEKYISKS